MIKRTLCIQNAGHLNLNNNQLVFTDKEGIKKTAPIEDIGYLIIENRYVTISVQLITALNSNNAAIIFCDEKYLPTGMLLNLDSNQVQTEIFHTQIEASEPLKKNLWKNVITCKIRNQAALLHKLNKNDQPLKIFANEVMSGDTSNREALAAKYYWHELWGSGFIRDRFGPPPNSLLNYGYIIIRSAMARALAGSGLLSTLGIFHSNRYNAFCLADDMMEPYRVYVDELVYEVWYKTDKPEPDKEFKQMAIQLLARDVNLEKTTRPLMLAMQQSSASLAKCYGGKQRKLSFPDFK
ncbi:MAG TPA: type II CRISPR-associated endonuclease Cas1 [Bacteroidales bacterium]|jgi:CRISPR-associated protein Cas1|nr:type II CRISPR-associated endonuclease Cas1 [Bacteroidales bacterium]MDI9573549.1 type II CRISPR-associated endonuclease Cas1 [Bacteroidota bacterium]MBP9511183.1 type II CRISPR-associated endonuclease Cas1 [Bacteroidales bacterium]MBP9587605.1 type II CRISPR-associated endonuclease Cas1 [Bacteroidales bacterium]HOE58559.1 type II CRISPR-associated endonuclease Cas1 [Bacteroidales bacterium]